MADDIRYEVSNDGHIVAGTTALSSDLDSLIQQLFSQYGWTYTEVSKHSAYRKIKVNSPMGESFNINLFAGNIRNEKRSPYEKKIQLNKEDPRQYKDGITIILGFYVSKPDAKIQDAIIVGYPVDEAVNYDTNPSIRGVFVNDILIKAKVNGVCVDRSRRMVGFRPEFVFYYLMNYSSFHNYEDGKYTSEELKVLEAKETYDNDAEENVIGKNILFYGVPGSGKSHSVDKICSDKARMERVVFHPEYTYSDFVGQIMPQVADDGKSIEYKFVEGPFTRILQTAYKEENRDTMFYLVIEEINRGNAPAVFGDIFQLLDRDETGASKYGIKNVDVAEKVFGKENKLADVKIPNNVTILATMNTSDQNVFTLDTAFQRRWEMTQVTNQFKPDHEFADKPISDTSVTWKVFNETVNEIIVRKNPMASTEDKRLGTYFIKAQDLSVGSKNFPEKVIKYLWDDAVKFKRDIIFNDKDYPTLENVIEHFENSTMDDRLKIFAEGLFKIQKTNISANDVVDEEFEDTEN